MTDTKDNNYGDNTGTGNIGETNANLPDNDLNGENNAEETQEGDEKAKPKKSPFLMTLRALNGLIMFLVILVVGSVVLLRFGASSDVGRSKIEQNLNGLKLGPIGKLYVHGLRGDIFTDFTVDYAALKDEKGTWADGRNFRIKWSPFNLAWRSVDIDNATIGRLDIYRRPIMKSDGKKSHTDLPVSVNINRLGAVIVSHRDFSVKEGVLGTGLSIKLKRNKDIEVFASVINAQRHDDRVYVDLLTNKSLPVRMKIYANEANGGPIAGIAGFNANLPINAKAELQGGKEHGVLTILAHSGNKTIADVHGKWDNNNGNAAGNIDLGASKITHEIATKFGGAIDVKANWSKPDGLPKDGQYFNASVKGADTAINASGNIDYGNRKTIGDINVSLTTKKMHNLLHSIFLNAGAASLIGQASGDIKDFKLWGPVSARDYKLLDNDFHIVRGNLEIGLKKGKLDVNVDFNGSQNRGHGILPKLIGHTVNGDVEVIRTNKGDVFVNTLNVKGIGVKLAAHGGVKLNKDTELKGKASVSAPILSNNVLTGLIDGNFTATTFKNGSTTLDANAIGNKLRGKGEFINKVLGNSPKASVSLHLGDKPYFTALSLKTADIEAIADRFDRSNLMGNIGGNIKIGKNTLKLAKLGGALNGRFTVTGIESIGNNGFAALGLNLIGNKFTTNISQLDEYVGGNPHLNGRVLISTNRVLVDKFKLIGSGANMDLSGQVVGHGDLSLKTKWQILRPLAVGPIEASGNLFGDGHIVGPYDNFNGNFTAHLSQLNIGGSVVKPATLVAEFKSGQKPFAVNLKLNGKSEFGDINGTAAIISQNNATEVRNINLSGAGLRAVGNARFGKNQNPTADFRIDASKGLLLSSGGLSGIVKIEQASNRTNAIISLSGRHFILRGTNLAVDTLNVKGAGDLKNLTLDTDFSLRAYQPLSFAGKTYINSDKGNTAIRFEGGGKFNNKQYSIADPLIIHLDDNKKSAKGKISIAARRAERTSSLEFDASQSGEHLNVDAKVDNFNISSVNQDFIGNFTGNMKLQNAGNHIEGYVDGKLIDARARGLKRDMAINGDIRAELKNEHINIKTNLYNGQGMKADGNATFRAVTSVTPLRLAIARSEPMSGSFSADGEVRPLADMVFAGQRYLSGKFNGSGTLSGTINDPVINGNFALANGVFREPDLGLTLKDLNVRATIDPQKIDITHFSAKDDHNGEIKGDGEVGLRGNSEQSFRIVTHKFRLVDNDVAKIDATGETVLEHIGDKRSRLKGKLRIDQAEFSPRTLSGSRVTSIDVEEINIPESRIQTRYENGMPVATKKKTASVNHTILLDVQLEAQRGIFIRGQGLNLELSLDSKISGTMNSPQIDGTARVVRGQYEYGGRAFDFEDRGTITLSEKPENIRINLTAKRESENLDAYINITGTAKKPEIALTSNPNLPPDEILAQVLFGRAKSQLSSIEAVQLATSLAALAGGGGFDVMSNLREFAGLDRLVFGNTADGEISFGGGKYLGRDLYLEVISQGSKGVNTSVEWRPTNSTAVISTVGSMGDAKLSIRWRRDFK